MPFLNVVDPAFDFTAPEVMAAQDADWYADSPIGSVVLRYAEAQELSRDRRLDHGGDSYLQRNGIASGPIYDWYLPMIVNQDGADHRRLRGLVGRSFTPRTVEQLRPFIRTTAERLADEIAAAGEVEFVDAFANRLPLEVMCELLGVPTADYDTFSVWTSDIGMVFGLAAGGDIAARVERAVVGLNGYVDELIDEKARRPAGDLISENGRRLASRKHGDPRGTAQSAGNTCLWRARQHPPPVVQHDGHIRRAPCTVDGVARPAGLGRAGCRGDDALAPVGEQRVPARD